MTKRHRQPQHHYSTGVDDLHELPSVTNFEDALEKHLSGHYYRYRRHASAEWEDHTIILDKE